MLSSAIQASLAEVLDVRDGLLMENETWTVLKSSLFAVSKLFKEGWYIYLKDIAFFIEHSTFNFGLSYEVDFLYQNACFHCCY